METCVGVASSAVSSMVSLQGVTIMTVSCQSGEKSFMVVTHVYVHPAQYIDEASKKFFFLPTKLMGF